MSLLDGANDTQPLNKILINNTLNTARLVQFLGLFCLNDFPPQLLYRDPLSRPQGLLGLLSVP